MGEQDISWNYFIRRVLYFVPILLGSSSLCFFIFHIVGGDPAMLMAGKHATMDQIQSLRSELGLDRNLLSQYFHFLGQVFRFDWGESWQTKQNINEMIGSRLPASLLLMVPSIIFSFFISVALAIFSTYARNSALDRIMTSLSLAAMSVSFLVYIIAGQYFLAYYFRIFPINGWDSGTWLPISYLILPCLISVSVNIGPDFLIYRSALREEINKDYIKTARAKGLLHSQIYGRHLLKNALIPIITVLIIRIPYVFLGSLLLESFFGIPGVGGMVIQAIQNADFPLLKALTIIGTIVYMFSNLLADLVYSFIDPRVQLR